MDRLIASGGDASLSLCLSFVYRGALLTFQKKRGARIIFRWGILGRCRGDGVDFSPEHASIRYLRYLRVRLR